MKLPNTRSAIRPDPGYALVEVDLRQADAQVVTWSADCRVLKSLLRRRVDIYTEMETGVWEDPKLPQSRQVRKNCVHSVDYGAGWHTLAEKYVADAASAKYFIDKWFQARPEIRAWQEEIGRQMSGRRTPTIYNVWGYRRVYACPVPITQPLAWIGQSTVSITKDHMILRIDDEMPEAELLLDGHDSVLMQIPRRKCPDCFPALTKLCEIEIPFAGDPLVIPVEIKWSLNDWGHMEKWDG